MSNAGFVRADILALPFAAESFDHVFLCFVLEHLPDTGAALAALRRVLRPGGTFVWADLRGADDVAATRAQLASSGLVPVRERDITAEVLHALRLDDARRAALVRAWIPRPFHRVFRPFAGLEGTRNHEGFADGSLRYLSARLVRPA